jgi:hypothetical protein
MEFNTPRFSGVGIVVLRVSPARGLAGTLTVCLQGAPTPGLLGEGPAFGARRAGLDDGCRWGAAASVPGCPGRWKVLAPNHSKSDD